MSQTKEQELQAALTEAQKQLNEKQDLLQRMSEECARMEERANRAEHIIKEIQRSRSWRMTGLVRWVTDRLRHQPQTLAALAVKQARQELLNAGSGG